MTLTIAECELLPAVAVMLTWLVPLGVPVTRCREPLHEVSNEAEMTRASMAKASLQDVSRVRTSHGPKLASKDRAMSRIHRPGVGGIT